MARSLEGKKFYVCSNNGVSAIIEERTLLNLEKLQNINRELSFHSLRAVSHLPITPIFTFVQRNRWFEEPWMTGCRELYLAVQAYITSKGGVIEGVSFFVPFSNGLGEVRSELEFATSESQFEDTFGITLLNMLQKK